MKMYISPDFIIYLALSIICHTLAAEADLPHKIVLIVTSGFLFGIGLIAFIIFLIKG